MASPTLSRSPSAHFAPGPHRRSHPNLQNLHGLSLAPLTPKYPIDPADYDAYYDPSTSELHTSSSLSHIAALPSPGGILTNSPARSRASSKSRLKKKAKSHVNILTPDGAVLEKSATATVGQGEADITDHKPTPKPMSKSQTQLHKLRADPSWLVQTGLSLTESSREIKGQSWISKRDSSTSLANTPVESYFEVQRRPRDGPAPRSGRATPARSRVVSRNASRNASRSRLGDLRMTSAATSPDETRRVTPSASFATAPEIDDKIREEDEEYQDVEPNWSDARTQAEIAAQLQEELAAEFEDADDGDPYGVLDFDRQGEDDTSEDEREVRKAMKKWRVGGWMDGAIEALLMVEEDGRVEEAARVQEEVRRASLDDVDDEDEVEPPERTRSVWDEVSWVGTMVKRNIGM